ncbi:hypothetical protein Dda_2509 [Drechslerella dactyloides]|uniref:Uncharacterized protein n=1 Tax=Drechslerella dactyloides TaxID=74499 RepID=A0AAD6J050_DREDA|nr:hypothetical protein Dda_2509 [Drechslerella dactyloides]
MSSRMLTNALKRQTPALLANRRYTPRLIRAIAPRSTSSVGVQIRNASLESELVSQVKPTKPEEGAHGLRDQPGPDLQSSTKTPSVAATIVAELKKANVRCTSIGIKELEEIYGDATYALYLRYNQSHLLCRKLYEEVVSNPNSLSAFDLNTSNIRQWRSKRALSLWIDYKVYKLWEALYRHSAIFKDMIDYEEKDIDSDSLWSWMARIIREGIVDRNDVDNLPEVMFRDIIVGSGEHAEKLASKSGA